MKKEISVSVVLLSVIAVFITWYSTHAFSNRHIQAESDPADLIREFVGQPDLELEEITADKTNARGLNAQTFRTVDKLWLFKVDTDQNQVIVAAMSPQPKEVKEPMDSKTAMESAVSFLTSRIEGFDKMALVEEKLLEPYEGWKVYSYTWAEQWGSQQAIGLHRIWVSIDAEDGKVVNFNRILPVPLTVDVEPTISREQALDIARKRFQSNVITSNTVLDVWWKDNDRTQEQVLRWTVDLESDENLGPDSEHAIKKVASYIINAHTGEVLEELR